MTTPIDHPASPANPVHPAMRRATTIVIACVAAMLVWLVATYVAGVDLHSPVMEPTKNPGRVGAMMVVMAALVAGLLGWAVLALFERTLRRPRAVWTWTALIAFVISLAAPLSGSGIDEGSRVGLVLLHASVAAVLIPLLRRTARPQRLR